jgi:hypothetical protein
MVLLPERVTQRAARAAKVDVLLNQPVTRPHDLREGQSGLEPPKALLPPPREASAEAKLRHAHEREEQRSAFNVPTVGVCNGGASPCQFGTEDIGVDDDRRTLDGHASAMAWRKRSSS